MLLIPIGFYYVSESIPVTGRTKGFIGGGGTGTPLAMLPSFFLTEIQWIATFT